MKQKGFLLVFILAVVLFSSQSGKAAEKKNYEIKDHMLYLYQNDLTTEELAAIKSSTEFCEATMSAPDIKLKYGTIFEQVKKIYLTKEVHNVKMNNFQTSLPKVFPNLEEIYVSEENTSYKSIDGVLYKKDGTELICYPPKGKKKAVVAEATRLIGRNAFRYSEVTEIYLPEKVLQIDESAFADSELTSILVSPDNPYYSAVDGILYRKNYSFLEYWPEKKAVVEYMAPSGMEVLDGKKIKNIQVIQTLILPDTLTACVNMSENQIKEIRLNENNRNLALFDGVLYSGDFTMLYVYPNQNPKTVIKLHDNLMDLSANQFTATNTTRALKLPKNLRTISNSDDTGAMAGFKSLSMLAIEDSNPYFTIKDGILYDKAMTTILWYPIDLCIERYMVPDSVTLIANGQLRSQNHLKELYVHKNCRLAEPKMQNIEGFLYEMPFGRECFALEKVWIEEGNPYFCSKDGVVFSADEKILYRYPCAKKDASYQMPSQVEMADFTNYNPYLKEITFSKRLFCLLGDDFNEGFYELTGGKSPFMYFTGLKKINPNGNTYYRVKNNVLYNSCCDLGEGSLCSLTKDSTQKTEEYLKENRISISGVIENLKFSKEPEKTLIVTDPVKEGYIFSKENKNTYQNEKIVTIEDMSLFVKNPSTEIYDQVEKVIVGDQVNSLSSKLFLYFPNVKTISLSKSVTDVAAAFSQSLQKLSEVWVDPKNACYTATDGILYNRDKTELICYPVRKAGYVYRFPAEVTYCFTDAFQDGCRVKNLYLNDKIGSDSVAAFTRLKKLRQIETGKNNPFLYAEDGILYDTEMTVLYLYPKRKVSDTYLMPETVDKIERNALTGILVHKIRYPKNISVNVCYSDLLSGSNVTEILPNDYANFEVEDGVIYNKGKTVLFYWPEKKEVKNLILPDTVTRFYSSIKNTETIETITIPRDLKEFYSIFQTDNLRKITVAKGNQYFKVYDGLLYNKTLTKLYMIPNISEKTAIHVPSQYKGSCCRSALNKVNGVTKLIIMGTGLYFPYECFPDLETFELQKGNTKAKVKDSVLYNADCSTLIWYPQMKTDCSFTVPSTVKSFRGNAFEVQKYLEVISLSKQLKLTMGEDSRWFLHCDRLKKILVPYKNPYLASIDGVLFTKDKKILLVYPKGKTNSEYTVLESVEEVYLNYNSSLKKLSLLSKVRKVESYYECFGFSGLTALQEIMVSEKNPWFYSKDGVLYRNLARGDELSVYPAAKKNTRFYLAESVIHINNESVLLNHRYLQQIYSESSYYSAYGTKWIEDACFW